MELPSEIGKFRVLELLGQGAMGRVYLAEDPLIDRKVAIKVMAVEGDEEARERFRNEARTVGQLSHPNIVQLHELGFHQGQPYLVMEYLVGESVEDWLRVERPLRAKISILLDLCRAVAHAHSRGVLHRDIKPSNLQVLPDGTCKLMDFGIARSRSIKLTATGTVLGTPVFIAPEVLRDAGYSARSDAYAVALVAYQMFAGINPFSAATLEGCLTRVMTHEPKPLAEVCPQLSVELSDVVAGYLCKDPRERPEDLEPLMAVLRRLADRTQKLETGAVEPTLQLGTAPALAGGAATADPSAVVDEQPAGGVTAPSTSRDRWRPTAVILAAVIVVAALLAARLPWLPWSKPEPESVSVPESIAVPAVVEPGSSPEPPIAQDPLESPDETPGDKQAPSGDSEPVATETVTKPPAKMVAPPERPPRKEPDVAPAEARSNGSSAASSPPPPPERSAAEPEAAASTGSVGAEDPVTPPDDPDAIDQPVEDTPSEPIFSQEPSSEPSSDAAQGVVEPVEQEEPSEPAPRIDRVEPAFVRRGSTVVLQIAGNGFAPEAKVLIRRGGRVVRSLSVEERQIKKGSRLRVTLLVDQQLPLGVYTVTVVDARGQESNAFGLEVGL